MRTRQVKSDAKNLIHWDIAQKLTKALEYASENLAALDKDDHLEDLDGTHVHKEDDYTMVASLFIGTVFSLTPSGKYYMPFACSNVELCPRCKGKGSLKVFETCHICASLGKRKISDLASLRNETPLETRAFLVANEFKLLKRQEFECNYCKGKGKIPKTCNWCEGQGSREAHLDSVWHDTLESKAGEYGIYVFSGEGDPCDLFLGMSEDLE